MCTFYDIICIKYVATAHMLPHISEKFFFLILYRRRRHCHINRHIIDSPENVQAASEMRILINVYRTYTRVLKFNGAFVEPPSTLLL